MTRRGRHVQRGLVSSSIANGLPPPESQLHTHTHIHSISLRGLCRIKQEINDFILLVRYPANDVNLLKKIVDLVLVSFLLIRSPGLYACTVHTQKASLHRNK